MQTLVVTAENRIQQIDQFNQAKIDLIKRTICDGATDDELQLFIEQCRRTGLDPVLRQIYFIKNKKTGKVQIQTSIDGFRLVAERSGNYEGQTAPQWCGEDGVWRDVWLSKTPPSACKVGIYKRGFREPLFAVALFDEYAQRHKYDDSFGKHKAGDLSGMWATMPSLMLSKVCESLAIRKAFPNDLSGLYTREEMAQSETESSESAPKKEKEVKKIEMPGVVFQAPVVQSEPAPVANSNNPPEFVAEAGQPYRVPFGKKYLGKTVSEIGLDDCLTICQFFNKKAHEENRDLTEQENEFIHHVENLIRDTRKKPAV